MCDDPTEPTDYERGELEAMRSYENWPNYILIIKPETSSEFWKGYHNTLDFIQREEGY